jgi:hypothetical protein
MPIAWKPPGHRPGSELRARSDLDLGRPISTIRAFRATLALTPWESGIAAMRQVSYGGGVHSQFW